MCLTRQSVHVHVHLPSLQDKALRPLWEDEMFARQVPGDPPGARNKPHTYHTRPTPCSLGRSCWTSREYTTRMKTVSSRQVSLAGNCLPGHSFTFHGQVNVKSATQTPSSFLVPSRHPRRSGVDRCFGLKDDDVRRQMSQRASRTWSRARATTDSTTETARVAPRLAPRARGTVVYLYEVT